MSYETLMNRQPRMWDIFTAFNEFSLIIYMVIAAIAIMITILYTYDYKKHNKSETLKHISITSLYTVTMLIIGSTVMYGYLEIKQDEWQNTDVKEYIIEKNITGEIPLENISYNQFKKGDRTYGKVMFMLDGRMQKVTAEIIESDVDEPYLKYYINDRAITKNYIEGDTKIGEIYMRGES